VRIALASSLPLFPLSKSALPAMSHLDASSVTELLQVDDALFAPPAAAGRKPGQRT
jgi:hypothetical protein